MNITCNSFLQIIIFSNLFNSIYNKEPQISILFIIGTQYEYFALEFSINIIFMYLKHMGGDCIKKNFLSMRNYNNVYSRSKLQIHNYY